MLGRAVPGVPAVVALATLAVVQPVLDLFGRNPTFFVAQDMGPGAVAAFGVAVTALPLAVVSLVVVGGHALGPRVGAWVRTALLALLAATATASLATLARVGGDLAFVTLVAGAGVGVAVAEARWEPVSRALGYAAWAAPAFLALFLVASPTAELLRADGVRSASGVVVADPAPVVVLVLDELPLTTLLAADGTVNASRFPRFAELAGRATWYRDATAVADLSPDSVPALLSGTRPTAGAVPTLHDYPDNLFTLLGGAYDVTATEPITELCPPDVCRPPPTPPVATQVGSALADAGVVLGHRVLPPGLRGRLPAVGQSWGGFLAGARSEVADLGPRPSRDEVADEVFELVASGTPPVQLYEATRAAIESLDPREATLWFHHALLPHWPWELTPSGLPYRAPAEGFEHPSWTDDGDAVARMYQRHVMQVGAADRLVGTLIDRLDALGAWERALVVVTSDHGAAFTPGALRRGATVATAVENYAVPLFVKLPGQRVGGIDDGNVELTDVVPTILDAVGATGVDVDFAGRSLLSGAPAPASKTVLSSVDPGLVSLDPSVDGVLAAAAALRSLAPGGEDWYGLVAARPPAGLVGRAVADVGVAEGEGGRWEGLDGATTVDVDLERGPVPVALTTRVVPPLEAGQQVAVAVNGTVAGVEPLGPGGALSVVLAPEAFVTGPNRLSAYLLTGGGVTRDGGATPGTTLVRLADP